MGFEAGKKFWIAATAVIVVVTLFVVGRNLLHAVKIKRQINALEREREFYRARIEQDSTLQERLRYDDYLEEYAREHYHMQAARRTRLYHRGVIFRSYDLTAT